MFVQDIILNSPLRNCIHKQELMALSPTYFQITLLKLNVYLVSLTSSLLLNTRTTILHVLNMFISENEYPSYSVYILDLICFESVCPYVDDYSNRSLFLTTKLLKQG